MTSLDKTWTRISLKDKLQSSNTWVARAIYRLSSDMQNIEAALRPATFSDDAIFFSSLCGFFADNGFFTDRHISIARLKMREPYLDYLVVLANT